MKSSKLTIGTKGIPDPQTWKSYKHHRLFDIQDIIRLAGIVTDLDLWKWLELNDPPKNTGYMFWSHENLQKIINHPDSVMGHHSGSSWACLLRTIQFIAKKGFTEWDNEKTRYCKSNCKCC